MNIENVKLWMGIQTKDVPLIVSVLWRVTISLFVLWSIGSFSKVGFPGFAFESQTAGIQLEDINSLRRGQDATIKRLSRIEARSILNSLQNMKELECNSRDKAFARDQISNLAFEYQLLTGFEWTAPSCSQLSH